MHGVELEVSGEVVEWRGPAPYHFLVLPDDAAADVREEAGRLSYGWGMVPVRGRVGQTSFTTAMWPREGGYWLPLKDAVRRSEGLALGDEVHVTIWLDDQT